MARALPLALPPPGSRFFPSKVWAASVSDRVGASHLRAHYAKDSRSSLGGGPAQSGLLEELLCELSDSGSSSTAVAGKARAPQLILGSPALLSRSGSRPVCEPSVAVDVWPALLGALFAWVARVERTLVSDLCGARYCERPVWRVSCVESFPVRSRATSAERAERWGT